MDKITKALLKLSSKEKELIKTILLKIKSDSLAALDVKKLKGHSDIFRVRHGKIRLIFQRNKAGEINILAIERRSDNTYNNY
jgi:mRNA-degrading endonuclease RelE of RelBE toxin-antitoxin system